MTDHNRVSAWIDGYVKAWNSNDPEHIGDLFTEDAEYYTAPFDPPWRGRDQIVSHWLERKDEPGETAFEWSPVSVTAEVAIIQGTTAYPDLTYSNLWVIRLGSDGRCREFTEWWMQHPS
ncbi:SgcJ/EcaC family oxidoreductase [Planobispora longispora]|uniref:SnoaL-like domain-containing protein n=1 Tax=Planobispora longispora TaxID=28887 RepID=A0A8J3W9H6_9ACTN|nr:SgcJ/EcaC family oxidoreductase [Planobispora longispora]GIH80808.1 hypothetical protein Plo01_72370 [Planobispora longispora]